MKHELKSIDSVALDDRCCSVLNIKWQLFKLRFLRCALKGSVIPKGFFFFLNCERTWDQYGKQCTKKTTAKKRNKVTRF